MNTSNFAHAFLALIAQSVIGLTTGNWWVGAAFGGAFYFGREVAQHEAHRLMYYGGFRASPFKMGGMPWYEGFKFWSWSADGKFDLLVPVAAVCALAYGMQHVA